MSQTPRLALGTVQSGVDSQPMTWALVDWLAGYTQKTQHFFGRAHFTPRRRSCVAGEMTTRYLDAWLMSEEQCQRQFELATGHCDFAVVEGRFRSAVNGGGTLEALSSSIELPSLAIVNANRLVECALPPKPVGVDGILLDHVASPRDFFRLQTVLEALWGVPVLGGLDALASARSSLATLGRASPVPQQLGGLFARSFARYARGAKLLRLASSRPTNSILQATVDLPDDRGYGITVAVAFDEAFHGYFPEALEGLQRAGARLRLFSPLRDEALPASADLVYLGAGTPEEYADILAMNTRMLSALRRHVSQGKRIYAEAGSAAYLCQQLVTPDGRCIPLVGALPAIARFRPPAREPEPITLDVVQPCWLAAEGTQLRGYRNQSWQFEPLGEFEPLTAGGDPLDVICHEELIASQVHFNLAALPGLLDSFARPAMSVAPAFV